MLQLNSVYICKQLDKNLFKNNNIKKIFKKYDYNSRKKY